MSEVVFSKVFAGSSIDIPSDIVCGDWEWLQVEISVVPSVSGAGIYLLPSVDGGASFINTNFHVHPILNFDTKSPPQADIVPAIYNGMLFLGNTQVNNNLDGRITIFQPNNGAIYKHSRLQAEGFNAGGFFSWQIGGEHPVPTSKFGCFYNALRLMITSGTMEGRVTIRGERNVDVFPAPANPVKKVAIIGASLVYQGGYCDSLRAALQAVWTTRTAVVRNFGSSGQGSPGALINIKSVIASQPDQIILALCAADSFPGYSISTAQSAANHATIIAAIRAALPSCQIFVMVENPMTGAGATNFPNLAAYYANGRAIATAQSVGLIDIAAVWGTPSAGQFQAGDGTHPLASVFQSLAQPTLVTALTA